ncbi:MAG: acyl-CoA dehydrogenase [Planctomycetaceae bacterium]
MSHLVETIDSPELDLLCDALQRAAQAAGDQPLWPAEQLKLCGEAGVYRWFLPKRVGGLEWSEVDLLRGYLRLSQACLLTAFILTQRMGAVMRIFASENPVPSAELLPGLLSGESFATLGISHLTTSRQHLAQPALLATLDDSTITLDGYSPWVTGGEFADVLVLGATTANGEHVLLAMPTDLPGVVRPASPKLVALSASHTGRVELSQVKLDRKWLLAGPAADMLKQSTGGKTGGLQTTALALGLSRAAIDLLQAEAAKRSDLASVSEAIAQEQRELAAQLLQLARGEAAVSVTSGSMRAAANSLVLRATQAALGACKGAGFLADHPAGRYAQQALFFLVWSCPQAVLAENLCQLAGIEV